MLYRIDAAEQLVGYTNIDWAGNIDDRRSTSGFALSLGSTTIPGSIKKQLTIALSSTKAEY